MNAQSQVRRRQLSAKLRVTAVALVLSLAGLVAGTVMYAGQAETVLQQTAHQADLALRLRQLQEILVTLAYAESGQRGYLLSGSATDLASYREASGQLPAMLSELDAIDRLMPALAGRTAQIREQAATKAAELAESVRLFEGGQTEAALNALHRQVAQTRTQALIDELQRVLQLVRDERDASMAQVVEATGASKRLAIVIVAALAVTVVLASVQILTMMATRNRYEQELAASEKKHRAIVEEQQELIALAYADGTLGYANPAFARQLGLGDADLTGRNLCDFFDPAERDAVRSRLAAVLRGGKPMAGEHRMLRPDARPMWVAWADRVHDAPGETRMLHSVGRDITERKLAEQALKSGEALLARTGRLARVGGWELDLRTGELRWSAELFRIHELPADHRPTPESAIGFFAPEAQYKVRQAIAAAREHGTAWDLELPMITAGGRALWVRTVGEVERDEAGVPQRVAGTLQDITQRRELERQLELRERFIRNIADNVPVRIAYIDQARRFQFVNRAHMTRFGRPEAAIIGRTRSELTGGSSDEVVEAHLERALAGRAQRFEYEDNIAGVSRCIESQLLPDVAPDGEVRGVFTIGVDITDRKAVERALRDLTEVFDNTPDYVVQTDWRGNILYLNPAVRRALGFEPDQSIGGRHFSEFNTPETNDRFDNEIVPVVKRDGVWVGEATVLGARRQVVPVSYMVIAHRDMRGRVARYSGIMRDISADIAARQDLARQTATLNSVIEAIPAMVGVWDAQTRYQLVNRAVERWRGKARDDVIGKTIEQVVGADDYALMRPWVQRALAGETVSYEKEIRSERETRLALITYVPRRLEDGTVDGFIGVAQDITPHRDERTRLRALAERDPLTGLLNRAGFDSWLSRQAEAGEGATTAVLFIDLDRFKPVNDTHGHAVGDEVLAMFAARLQRLVRPTDAVARLGGDEFAIVLSGVTELGPVHAVARKVVDAAARPFEIGELRLSLGASVGAAIDASGEGGWKALVARADALSYQAKAERRQQQAVGMRFDHFDRAYPDL